MTIEAYNIIVRDKFSIPLVEEMFEELGGAMVFSKIDLRTLGVATSSEDEGGRCVKSCL